jgi:predicted peptidase
LGQGQTKETDYPAARLLAQAEAANAAIQSGKTYFGGDKTGQFWLRVPNGKNAVTIRLLAPDSVNKNKALPLVIAMHGAGGSENLFFEGYGAGKIVSCCQERGWLLVAPRGGFGGGYAAAEVIDEVAKLYPVDKNQVFLVGHSLGAGQAISAAQQTPARFAAVAALGGGGTVKADAALKELPFFIGVGTKDFALAGARGLRDNLNQTNAKSVVYREYEDIEHLVIVREALPEVFAFFDKSAKGK